MTMECQQKNKVILFDFFGVISSEVSPIFFKRYFNEEEALEIKEEIMSKGDKGELNEEEVSVLGVEDCDFIVYGRTPLMISTQCVRDNVFHCALGKKTEGNVLSDRMGAEFLVRQICSSCYNIIYNSACFSFSCVSLLSSK